MIETSTWTLPGGYALPVTVETVTLREYEPEPLALSHDRAQALLEGESRRLTLNQMTAGRIEGGSAAIYKSQNGYRCRGVWNCVELISKTLPVELFGEDDVNGKTDQRGTN